MSLAIDDYIWGYDRGYELDNGRMVKIPTVVLCKMGIRLDVFFSKEVWELVTNKPMPTIPTNYYNEKPDEEIETALIEFLTSLKKRFFCKSDISANQVFRNVKFEGTKKYFLMEITPRWEGGFEKCEITIRTLDELYWD